MSQHGLAQEQPRPSSTEDAESGVVRQLDRDVVYATGEGIVRATPDRARVTVTAEARDRAPRAAQKKNAQVMTAVQARLKELGISADAVRTTSVDLQPQYDYPDGKQRLRDYVARNSIEVRVDDIARLGEIIDAAVTAGATEVSSIQFELKQREALERDALKQAVADARARAEAMAAAAGRALDRIVRLDDQIRPSLPPPMPFAARAREDAVASAAPTPVAPGEMEIQARVALTATLK
ncbi:MAG: SIMPL domain-containing protein [Vicinamibacteraceae bacterium]